MVRIVFVAFGVYSFGLFAILLFVGVTLWFIATYFHRWGMGAPWKRKSWSKSAKKFEEEQQLRDQIQYLHDAVTNMPPGKARENMQKEYHKKVELLKRSQREP